MHGTILRTAMIPTKKNWELARGKVIGVIKLPRELDGYVEGKSQLGARKWTTGRYVYMFTRPLYPNI